MATSGLDGKLKIWDLRTYRAVSETSFFNPAHSVSFSQSLFFCFVFFFFFEIF